ncbi:KPN_02809 family neutral zinc metallopeptidase [Chromobacterium phragmitis]
MHWQGKRESDNVEDLRTDVDLAEEGQYGSEEYEDEEYEDEDGEDEDGEEEDGEEEDGEEEDGEEEDGEEEDGEEEGEEEEDVQASSSASAGDYGSSQASGDSSGSSLGGMLVIGVALAAIAGVWWLFGGSSSDSGGSQAASAAPRQAEIAQQLAPPAGKSKPAGAQKDKRDTAFVKVILADTEDVWGDLFRRQGLSYQPPKLVLYTGSIRTGGCGKGDVNIGPFYCPADRKVYLDSTFFRSMRKELGGKAEFGQAYVVAHEVGHHVQKLLGISDKVDEQASRGGKKRANALSVRQELQADCLAGVWGHYANQRHMLAFREEEEGIRAASNYGDDTLAREAGAAVRPDAFTHGSSEQRMRWFRRGFDSGDMAACDTFRVKSL